MSLPTNNYTLTQAQINHLGSLHTINIIDNYLKVVSSINITSELSQRVRMELEIYYHNDKVSVLSFDLHNYTYTDIIKITNNIHNNEFILQEIDNFLSGDMVE